MSVQEAAVSLQAWRSHKVVNAGQIIDVVPAGCYVQQQDGSVRLYQFPENMTVRYIPREGDYWVVYDQGKPSEYQSISPKEAFDEGYSPICD